MDVVLLLLVGRCPLSVGRPWSSVLVLVLVVCGLRSALTCFKRSQVDIKLIIADADCVMVRLPTSRASAIAEDADRKVNFDCRNKTSSSPETKN